MRVLIADDEKLLCSMLTQFVEACGHEVVGAISGGGIAVMKAFAETKPDVVLLDVMMPKCNGLTVCHALLSRRPDAKVVFMSGLVDWDHPYITGCKASGFLRKPMLIDELRELLDGLDPSVTAMPPEVIESEAAAAA